MSGSTDAGGLLQFSEYRARHVNDECSEAAAPLPGARKGTEYANVLPQTWIAENKEQHYISVLISLSLKWKEIYDVWAADRGLQIFHSKLRE